MSVFSIAFRGARAAALVAFAILLCAFTFRSGGPPELHFEEYGKPPRGNTVTVCHSHGCAAQETFTFSDADIREIATLMETTRNADTALEERRAIAYAVGWMERRVGPSTGTAHDRASLAFISGSGQLDCVDEATNATSYLMVLQYNGLLRHHFVIRPFSKASFFKWPHFAAMIQERGSGDVYAVDSGVGPNGSNPAITLASNWYIRDSYTAPESEPPAETVPAAAPMAQGGDSIGLLVQQILRDERVAAGNAPQVR